MAAFYCVHCTYPKQSIVIDEYTRSEAATSVVQPRPIHDRSCGYMRMCKHDEQFRLCRVAVYCMVEHSARRGPSMAFSLYPLA